MFKSNFSFRKATGSPEQVVKRLAQLGYTHAPIADINNTFAWVRWDEACKANGLKPVFGVSLHVVPIIEAKKPVTDLWTFYAIDDVKPLNDLIRKAYSQGRSLSRVGFTPLLKYSDIAKIDNLVCVSGYRARLEHMNHSQENVYVGLQPACAKGFVSAAADAGFKFFALQDARYVLPEDRDFYQITCGYDCDLRTWPQWILSEDELKKELELRGFEI